MTAVLESVQPVIRRLLHGDVQRAFGPPLVELSGVGRRYVVGGNTVDALADIDLTIRAGEFVVVLGPSGSGKTTLLNLIGGLDVPTAGRIRVARFDLSEAPRRSLTGFRRGTVSFVFQTFNLFPGLTALENVAFGADVAGRSAPTRVALEQLERVGLADRAQHFPHALSGGEQQRVAIARALATDNPVLLADEPTGELDFRTGVRILDLLRAQAGPGRAVIVVTHNRQISRAADRVVELSSGHIVADGPPSGGTQPVERLHW